MGTDTITLPPQPQEAQPANPDSQTWRPLRLLNLYRLMLAGLFAALALGPIELDPLGKFAPGLFTTAAVLYLAGAIASSFTIAWRRPHFTLQVYLQVVLDIVALTLIMHASGGVKSGIGMLLLVAIIGGSILLAGQAALRLAAGATLAMLGEHIYFQVTHPLEPSHYSQAGLLGAAFFATALLAHALARRLRDSEALAERRGVDLASMAQLTQYIVQRMQTGIVVIDRDERVWLTNESARHLLGLETPPNHQPLATLCPELADFHRRWRHEHLSPGKFRCSRGLVELQPRFAGLGAQGDDGTLIFLEDTAALAQQAQQLKLASLGRLAGSIAHEIRNPLGAISHAGQLLAESEHLDNADLRLTEIIRTNSQRMNSIIENILQLGRRRQAKPETIPLRAWLEQFVDEFCRAQQIDPAHIQVEVVPDNIEVEFDPSQLHQVIWNMCHNGIRHSLARCGEPRLKLHAALNGDSPVPHLDVIDFGGGVDPAAVDNIFEPFFTTETKGTGLGLYIARELSESNHAHLTYLPANTGGACFRLTFADPRRRRAT